MFKSIARFNRIVSSSPSYACRRCKFFVLLSALYFFLYSILWQCCHGKFHYFEFATCFIESLKINGGYFPESLSMQL